LLCLSVESGEEAQHICLLQSSNSGKGPQESLFYPPWIEPSKTHTLIELRRELKKANSEPGPELEGRIDELNKFYAVPRYPDAAAG